MGKDRAFAAFGHATEKQLEAIDLAAEGLISKQIARQLGVTPRSIDQRIDALRQKAGNMARTDLVRHYRAWMSTRERIPCDPIPVTQAATTTPQESLQPVTDFVFEDSLTFDERAPWDRERSWLRPEIKPSDLGIGQRLLFITAGAVLILIGVVLTAAFSNALIELLGG